MLSTVPDVLPTNFEIYSFLDLYMVITMKRIGLFILVALLMIGVCGCMNNNQLYGTKTRKESNEEYAQMMLGYIEKKYATDFEIINYIFPEEGFNTNSLQSILLVKETQRGIITHVYATLGSPYIYYDAYVSDLASWENRQLVDCSALDGLGSAKLYFYLRDEDVNALDISKENVSRVVLLVNITQKPDTEILKKLYAVYQELFTLDYEYVFLVAGFTEQSADFDNFVQSYRVFGKKKWVDYGGNVYATLTAQDAGLTFEAFQNLCERK